jgi:hypothetical protein
MNLEQKKRILELKIEELKEKKKTAPIGEIIDISGEINLLSTELKGVEKELEPPYIKEFTDDVARRLTGF